MPLCNHKSCQKESQRTKKKKKKLFFSPFCSPLPLFQDSVVRTVIQFHYGSWPDHGVPPAVTPILELVRLMRDVQATETRAILVHCSAGCGRTGTICSIDYVWALLRAGKLDSDFSLYKIIYDMRKQRIAMVQTLEQYMLCYKAVAALFEQQLKIIDAHTYENLDEDGEPLFLRSLSMQSNSSSSDFLVNSDDEEECGGQTSVKTYSSSNAATVSSGWSSNRLDKNSIDSGIIIVNNSSVNSAMSQRGAGDQENKIADQVRRQDHEEMDVVVKDEPLPLSLGKEVVMEELVTGEGREETKQQHDEKQQRMHQQQQQVIVHGLHERLQLPHPNQQDGSVSDCLRMRRAPSLDSLMSYSASSVAQAAANCQLLHHHHHHQRQHSHPHPPHHQEQQQNQQTPHHLQHQPPPSSSHHASEGLVRPEKLVGKATVIRRSSIAKLKAMFETLSAGEDNSSNNNNCSSHHHPHHNHHYGHRGDHASRRIRLQRSQSTREQGCYDTQNHNSNNSNNGGNKISSCKIFAAAHSYHQQQRQRSAATSSSSSSAGVTGLTSPMDISHEAAAVAAQAFSLKLDSDQDQREGGGGGGGGQDEDEREEMTESTGERNSGQVVSHTFRSSSNNYNNGNNNNNDSSQASASSTPSTDQSLSDPASDCMDPTRSPGHHHHESDSNETTDAMITIRETGAVPKKSSLKVSKSGRSSSSGSSGGKANAPPKPPRTYQYGPAGAGASSSSDKERGKIIARLSTPNGISPVDSSAQHQQQPQQEQENYSSYADQRDMMQQHHNHLNRNHLSAPVLPNHHAAHISVHHASQSQPQAASHPHPSPLTTAVSMDPVYQHHQHLQHQQQQHLHNQALAAGLHPVPSAHHLVQKPEAIYQTLVPRQMFQRPNPQIPPHASFYHHPAAAHQQYHQQQQQQQPIYGMIGMRREYHHLSVPSLFPQSSQSLSLSLTPQPGILHPHHNHHHHHPHHALHQQQQHLPLQPLKPVMSGSARITNMQPGLSPAQISYLQQQQQQQQQQHLHQLLQTQASQSSLNPAGNNNPVGLGSNRMISSHHYRNNNANHSNHVNDQDASTPTYEDIYDVIPASLQKKRPILVEKETRPPVTYVRPQPNPQLQLHSNNNSPATMDAATTAGNTAAVAKEKEKDAKSGKHHSSKNQSSGGGGGSGSNKSTVSVASSTGSKLKSSHSTSHLAVVGGGGGKEKKNSKDKNKDPSSSSSSSSGKKSFSLSIFFGGSSASNKKQSSPAGSSSKDASKDLHHNHFISNNNNNNNNNNNGHNNGDRKAKKKSHSLHSSVQNLTSSQISAPTSSTTTTAGIAPTAGSSGFSGSSKVIFSRPPHSHRFSPPAQWTQV